MKRILSLLILTLLIISSLGISFADTTVIENDPAVTITTVRDSTKILSSKVIDTNYQTRSEWHEETFEYSGIRHTHEILKVANINAGTVDMRALFTFEEKWYVDDHDTKVKFISRGPKEITRSNIQYASILPFTMNIIIYQEGIGGTTVRLAGNISSTSGGTKSFDVKLEI